MTLKTRKIRINATNPDGTPAASAALQAELTSYEVDGGVIVPTLVRGQTDSTGTALIELWPNDRGTAGSQYRVKATKSGALLLNVLCTVPDGTYATEVLLESIITAIAPATVDDAQLAVLQAQALVDEATTQAGIATAKAVLTAADADSTAADVVLTHADVVLTHADVVLTHADAAATAALYDSFDDRYLGAKTADPTLDNDGNALIVGALYFNITVEPHAMRVWSGTIWDAAYATLGDALSRANNLSELANAATARTNLGLGNVDNTSDANKPVSTAQALADTAIGSAAAADATSKANAAAAASTPVAHATNTSNPHSVTATQVGLGNVDNTSDANKPVSTAQALADTAIGSAAAADATSKANAAQAAAIAHANAVVVGLWDDRGSFDASVNTYPTTGGSGTAGTILKGDIWTVSVVAGAGVLLGYAIGTTVRAVTDAPGQTASNWAVSEVGLGYVPENAANKDASGGYPGLTLFKLNLRNAANTITSWFTTAATVARTWTMPDKDGTVAMTSDITGTNSGTNTGDNAANSSAATAAQGAAADAFRVDMNDYGFVDIAETTIAFDGTSLFTLGCIGTTWSYYRAGVKYTITGSKTLTVASPMVNGTLYFIVIDSTTGVLSSSTSPWTLRDSQLPVATVYYNATLTPTYTLSEERHCAAYGRVNHLHDHYFVGTRMQSLGALSGYTINTDTNAAKTFATAASVLIDEDLFQSITGMTQPNGTATDYTVMYRTAASTWAWKSSNMPFVYNVGNTSNICQYDSAGTMTNAQTGSARWVNSYVVFTNVAGAMREVIIPGRAQFTTLALAQAEDPATFSMTGFPCAEFVMAYRLTWAVSTAAYASQGQCRLAATPAQIAVSTINTSFSGAGIDHETLAGLLGGGVGDHNHLTTAQVAQLAAAVAHGADTANPHGVTKTQVGLDNADNTSDANKPVSTAQALADTAIGSAAAADATSKANAAIVTAEAYADALSVSVVKLNPRSITSNLTIASTYNAASVGPITVVEGITVTVSDNATWSIH